MTIYQLCISDDLT